MKTGSALVALFATTVVGAGIESAGAVSGHSARTPQLPAYRGLSIESPSPEAHSVFSEVMHTVGHDFATSAETSIGASFPHVGRVWVFSGRTQRVLLTLNDPVPQASAGFGVSITAVGRINHNGIPNIAVGAPFQLVGSSPSQGEVWVYSGQTGKLLYTVQDPNPQPNASFGSLTSAATGDLNGDGVPDFVETAPGETVNGVPTAGAAYVLSGKDGRLIRRIPNPQPSTYAFPETIFGMGITDPGDVDGDHVDDLAIGFTGAKVSGNINQGRVYLFSGRTGRLIRTLDDPVPQQGAFFGSSYSDPGVPGDVNGDGIPDIYEDADGQTVHGFSGAGQAYIFSGKDGKLLRTLRTPKPETNGFFGFITSPAGDLNRDGTNDLLIGQTGAAHIAGKYAFGGAWVYNPRTGKILADFTRIAPDAGEGLASPGDVNGDRCPDYFLGAPRTDIGTTPRQGRAFAVLSIPPPAGCNAPAPPQVRGPRSPRSHTLAVYHFSAKIRHYRATQLKFRCARDRGTPLHSCTSTMSIRFRKGAHVLRVQAVDPSGNHSITSEVEINAR